MTLELSDLKAGLNCVGKHPILQKHVYLECNLSNRNLTDISCIAQYPHLMYLDLSNNCLETLDVLSNLTCAVQVNAGFNKLKSCLDFSPKKCTKNNSWPTGGNAIGSMVTLANLEANEIETIDNLDKHPFLEVLILSNNKIRIIDGLLNLKFLQVLDLSCNNITEISGLDHLKIQELCLRGNKISSLNGLENLPCLVTLDVSNNNIFTLEPLRSCTSLHCLNLRGNQVIDVRETEHLTHLLLIRRFVMADNPCSMKKYYRFHVIYRVPQLVQLDMTDVAAEDKVKAMNLYRCEGGDSELRRQTFEKYFPDSEFVDYTENFDASELSTVIEKSRSVF